MSMARTSVGALVAVKRSDCEELETAVARSMSGIRRHTRGSTRNAQDRKTLLDIDLNQPASIGDRPEVGSTSTVGQALPPMIDVEAIEDDVVISSPRRFAEATNMSRHTRGTPVLVDEDPGARPSHSVAGKRLRRETNRSRRRAATNQVVIDCDDEPDHGTSASKRKKIESAGFRLVDASAKEVTFNCIVCWNTLVEPMSTVCGHIFCKDCIKTSINVQKKCPTCRRKLTLANIHRVYLPSATSS